LRLCGLRRRLGKSFDLAVIYGVELLEKHLPGASDYLTFLQQRPHVQQTAADRAVALQVFLDLGTDYAG
jgi:hypothetical protein